MIQGETIATGAVDVCCGVKLELQVLRSGGGYYIGTWCNNCGPYSRESGYYPSREIAEQHLADGTFGR